MMAPFLSKIFNHASGNAAGFKVKPQPEREAATMFVTTLLERVQTQAFGHAYFCMAAEQADNGMWHVYRHRYRKDLTPYSTMAFPHPDRLCSLEAACAKMQAFEQENAHRKDRTQQVPKGAKPLAEMVTIVKAARLESAQKSGGLAMRLARKGKLRNGKATSP